MEIEVKLKYKNKSKIVDILKKSGFGLKKTKTIWDLYFGNGHLSMSNSNNLYRIRQVDGDFTELTLKDKCVDNRGIWTRRELNVTIDSMDNMVEILKTLNCNYIKEHYSIREIWGKDDLLVEFVKFTKPVLINLIEIEGENNEVIQNLVNKFSSFATVCGEEIFKPFDR